MIVTVTVSPGANGVTTLVGTALGVGAGSACPHGALFSGRPWPSCCAQFIGACNTKWAWAPAGIDTPAMASRNAEIFSLGIGLPYSPVSVPLLPLSSRDGG